jgi:hypothetical protein
LKFSFNAQFTNASFLEPKFARRHNDDADPTRSPMATGKCHLRATMKEQSTDEALSEQYRESIVTVGLNLPNAICINNE